MTLKERYISLEAGAYTPHLFSHLFYEYFVHLIHYYFDHHFDHYLLILIRFPAVCYIIFRFYICHETDKYKVMKIDVS